MVFPARLCFSFIVSLSVLTAVGTSAAANEAQANEPPAKRTDTPVEVPYAKLDYKDDLYLLAGKPFTGVATQAYKNGHPSLSYPFFEGRLHGLVREWYEDGTRKTATNFDKGQRHGANTYWFPDGSVMKEQRYDHDKLMEEKHFAKGEKKD